mmetsp:Transcript_463/g.682  ORF Transcript_463/g.682 Transcript_463/m.682 type:complete len:148 (+) Transcript_463:111-554(+)|eukprot:CAMPEP_0194214844 /NCGR_PEP_ID=MMETSP0156-20130528/16237_1 /TAXON_ID=33649 /ORGANISM="Thalassionema nitzschioides, Strain L26-B" /LENGTH=147 /DNA_ID=CAMNT_0038943191 /DNA_START=97 /DNA_END=540 /DNA_ORIENTATION=-
MKWEKNQDNQNTMVVSEFEELDSCISTVTITQSKSTQLSKKPEIPKHQLKQQKHVSFGSLEIRQYPIIIGSNSACLDSLPMSLSWDYRPEERTSVDEFEKERLPTRTKRIEKLSYEERKSRIGLSEEDNAVRHYACLQKSLEIPIPF